MSRDPERVAAIRRRLDRIEFERDVDSMASAIRAATQPIPAPGESDAGKGAGVDERRPRDPTPDPSWQEIVASFIH